MDHLTESLHPYGGGQAANDWMVSTWRRFGTRTSRRELSVIGKPVYCTRGIPNPLLTWRRRAPTIAHVVALKPRATYERQSRSFRIQARARLG